MKVEGITIPPEGTVFVARESIDELKVAKDDKFKFVFYNFETNMNELIREETETGETDLIISNDDLYEKFDKKDLFMLDYQIEGFDGMETIKIIPTVSTYEYNNNLFVGFDYLDKNGFRDSFCDVTVNIQPLDYLCAAIDVNNLNDNITEFLEDNNFGKLTGEHIKSGYCTYPIFKFNEDMLKVFSEKDFGKYQETARPKLEEHINKAKASVDGKIYEGFLKKQDEREI